MSNDVDAQVRAVRERIVGAQRARVRAEQERDAAAAQADAARAALSREFGVDTVEQAKDKLAELQHKLATELGTLRKLLDEIGA